MTNVVINEQIADLGRQKVSFIDAKEVIPQEIRDLLSGDWKNRKVLSFLLEHSEVCRILRQNPASAEMLEIAYYAQPIFEQNIKPIDKWLHDRLSGQALRDRLQVVSSFFAELLQKEITLRGRPIRIIDFGAGPAPYAIASLQKVQLNRSLSNLIFWKCVDLDQLALDIGLDRASRLKLDCISFERANFLSRDSYPESPNEQFDFGLLIGILCGMTCEEAVNCLRKIQPHFRNGGEIVAATLLKKSFEEDPQSFRIYCNVLGWQLRPKTIEEVQGIFSAAGWKIFDIGSERNGGDGQYAIVHAKIV